MPPHGISCYELFYIWNFSCIHFLLHSQPLFQVFVFLTYQTHHWPPWPWFHHLLPPIHPPSHQMIDFPEIIICSKPTDDFPQLSHLLFTRVVSPVASVELGKGKWPALSPAARMRAETGTQVFFPWTRLPFSSPQWCTFCRHLMLSQLFRNPTTKGRKYNLCRFYKLYC